jgi:peptidoglycan/xylan/chitin deacetylase (PgdA/CDA1 family)
MKRLFLALCSLIGISNFFRFLHKHQLTVLLYHGVAQRKEWRIFNYQGKFIEPVHFDSQMRYFRKHYTILRLDEAVEKLRCNDLPAYSLAITFDDGYRNFYTHAYPILKKYNIPATMFLATDFVLDKKPLWVDRLEFAIGGQSGSKEEKKLLDARLRSELKKLTSSEREKRLQAIERRSETLNDFENERSVYAPLSLLEMREMAEQGISFGAHTKSHPILARESKKIIDEEIREAKEALESKGIPLSSVFAYPNGQPGDWNEDVEQVVARTGFTSAVTTVEGANEKRTNVFAYRRNVMDATSDDLSFAAIAAGVRSALRAVKGYAN